MALPWHQDLITEIKQKHKHAKLPHGIALTAPTGWGLHLLAEQLVRDLLSLEGNQPIVEVAHPDLRWVEPEGNMLKVDQIRAIRDFAVQTPQIAGLKLAVFIDADLLSTASANALLKTLEEPPPNTYILLCSEQYGRLLPTIRSRCQRLQMTCSYDDAITWLTEQGATISDEEFAVAGYAPLAAFEQASTDIKAWLQVAANTGLKGGGMAKPPEYFVDWLARWYRVIVGWVAELAVANPARASSLIDFSEQLLHARRQLRVTNSANETLLYEQLVYRWQKLHRGVKV